MADPAIRFASVFYEGKKLAWMQSNSYSQDSNDTIEMVDSGTFFTTGRGTGTLSCTTINPITGEGDAKVSDIIQHKTVTILVGLVDGKIHRCKARGKSFKFDSDVPSGKLTGQFEWMLSEPKLV